MAGTRRCRRGVWNGNFYKWSFPLSYSTLFKVNQENPIFHWIPTRFYQQGRDHPDRYNHRKSVARYYFIDKNKWILSWIFRNLWLELKYIPVGYQDGRKFSRSQFPAYSKTSWDKFSQLIARVVNVRPFLILHFSYYTLMTFLIMLSVILLSMLMILLSTLNVIRHLICGSS